MAKKIGLLILLLALYNHPGQCQGDHENKGNIVLHLHNGSYHEKNMDSNSSSVDFVALEGGSHPCKRPCVSGQNMQCRYRFEVEWYYTMSKACYDCPVNFEDCYRPECIIADGQPRSVVVVNRQLPGPAIEICVNDEVLIDVDNQLFGETTTMHWHGHHQIGTPYMDGVPGVTQCPIESGTVFTYKFNATNSGTHFWHSHSGIQRGDGTYGAFIVHVPDEEDPHRNLYDFDLTSHIIAINDWDNVPSTEMFLAHYHYGGTNKPAKLLINGLGMRNFTHPENNTPIARFEVEKGFKYRFRLINAGFLNCPIEMSFDGHSMQVISTDGNDIEPVIVDSLVSYAGERFDFIVTADQDEGLYWMRFRGLMDCDERFTSAHQVAVLQYKSNSTKLSKELPSGDVPTYETSHKEGLQLNPLNKGVESSKDNETITIPELRSITDYDASSLMGEPDEKFFISYDFYKMDTPMYHKKDVYGFYQVKENKRVLTPQLNHIAFKLQPTPLLQGRDNIPDSLFCNETTEAGKNCTGEFCKCTHVMQVKLNSIVELILIDAGFAYDANHPFHLHGHSFRVIGMERLSSDVTAEEVKELDKQGKLKRNFINPPVKDTVTIPDGGYTIVRFNASNPGYWLFHCHIDFHVEVGMALVFKFGENEDMPPTPVNFPTCGSYSPDSRSTGHTDIIPSSLVTILMFISIYLCKNQ